MPATQRPPAAGPEDDGAAAVRRVLIGAALRRAAVGAARFGRRSTPFKFFAPKLSVGRNDTFGIGSGLVTLKETRAPCATDYRVLHRPAVLVLVVV